MSSADLIARAEDFIGTDDWPADGLRIMRDLAAALSQAERERDEALAAVARMQKREQLYLGPDCGVILKDKGESMTIVPLCVHQREALDKALGERDEALAEIERLRAGGCARDQRTTQWCAEAVEQRSRAEQAERERDEARALLREARGWLVAFEDPLDPALVERIDTALAAAQERGEG